ncbi:MAG: tetratricopeptide repeat protein, partial [Chloroflexota bacterium]
MQRKIRLCGELRIEEDGRSAPILKSPKGCALLVYMLMQKSPQRREAIADLLWDAPTTARSLHNLRQLLSRVRDGLPELDIGRRTIELHSDMETSVDWYQLETALDEDDAVTQAKAIQTVYRGEFLSGVYIEDAPRFNEWVAVTREQMRQTVWQAFDAICQAFCTQEKWQEGVHLCRHWVSLDELDDTSQLWLITMLAKHGEPKAALAQYERYRNLFWQQLEIDVAPEIKRFVQQLKTQLVDAADQQAQLMASPTPLDLPSLDAPIVPGPLPPSSILPFRRNGSFTGREPALIDLAKHLLPWPEHAERENVMAITGLGGLGKTQLAIEFAFRYGRFFPGGVFWISFAESNSIRDEIALTGSERGMGLFRETDQLSLNDQIGLVQRAWQDPIPRLLIFDNCESEGLLSNWLPVTGGCRVLVTSRRANWDIGLKIKTLPLLALSRNESASLLTNLVERLTVQDAEAIAAAVGDLPLAIHLVGSFLARYRSISSGTYLDQLNQTGLLQHPSLQGRGVQFSPTGHELNIARTFAINIRQLESEDQINVLARQLLARIACLSAGDPITQKLLMIIASDPQLIDINDPLYELLIVDGLNQLIQLGFLEQKGRDTWFIHPLIAAFVQDTLKEMGSAQSAVQKIILTHMTHHDPMKEFVSSLPVLTSHLRAILEEKGAPIEEVTAELAAYFGRHLTIRNEFKEAITYLERAYRLNQQLYGEPNYQAAYNQFDIGVAYLRHSQFEAAIPFFDRALDSFSQLTEASLVDSARVYNYLSETNSKLGRFEEALAANQTALNNFAQVLGENHLECARCWQTQGTMFAEQGMYLSSQAAYERSLEIFEVFYDSDDISIVKIEANLGWIYLQTGHFEKGQAALEHALQVQDDGLGSEHQHTLSTIHSLGQLYYEQGDYA